MEGSSNVTFHHFQEEFWKIMEKLVTKDNDEAKISTGHVTHIRKVYDHYTKHTTRTLVVVVAAAAAVVVVVVVVVAATIATGENRNSSSNSSQPYCMYKLHLARTDMQS
jgi:hypothetical protein